MVKNFVATEFLYDYLRDKKTVGVIDEDPELGIEYVAEPMGVIVAITPITNPTSTVLFKAICAAKTRNAILFRAHPMATGCALPGGRDCSPRPARPPACRPGRSRSSRSPSNEVTHYLFKHPGRRLPLDHRRTAHRRS